MSVNYEKLVNDVKEVLPERFSGVDFSLHDVKSSTRTYTALTCKPENSNVGININLNKLLEDADNLSYSNVVRRVCEEVTAVLDVHIPKANTLEARLPDFTDFDQIIDRLTVAPVAMAAHSNIEPSVSRIVPGNIMIVPKAVVDLPGQDGVGSVTVTPELLQQWNVSIDKVYEVAFENMLHNYELKSMFETLTSMLSEEEMSQVASLSMPTDGPQMYVLTNSEKVNGGALCYVPGLMESISNSKFAGADIAILPSSVHETILVTVDDNFSAEALNQMIHEVNETQVAPEERMGEVAIVYDAKAKELITAKEYEQELTQQKNLQQDYSLHGPKF